MSTSISSRASQPGDVPPAPEKRPPPPVPGKQPDKHLPPREQPPPIAPPKPPTPREIGDPKPDPIKSGRRQ